MTKRGQKGDFKRWGAAGRTKKRSTRGRRKGGEKRGNAARGKGGKGKNKKKKADPAGKEKKFSAARGEVLDA